MRRGHNLRRAQKGRGRAPGLGGSTGSPEAHYWPACTCLRSFGTRRSEKLGRAPIHSFEGGDVEIIWMIQWEMGLAKGESEEREESESGGHRGDGRLFAYALATWYISNQIFVLGDSLRSALQREPSCHAALEIGFSPLSSRLLRGTSRTKTPPRTRTYAFGTPRLASNSPPSRNAHRHPPLPDLIKLFRDIQYTPNGAYALVMSKSSTRERTSPGDFFEAGLQSMLFIIYVHPRYRTSLQPTCR